MTPVVLAGTVGAGVGSAPDFVGVFGAAPEVGLGTRGAEPGVLVLGTAPVVVLARFRSYRFCPAANLLWLFAARGRSSSRGWGGRGLTSSYAGRSGSRHTVARCGRCRRTSRSRSGSRHTVARCGRCRRTSRRRAGCRRRLGTRSCRWRRPGVRVSVRLGLFCGRRAGCGRWARGGRGARG